jgi:serine/threonine protein kinase
MGHVSLPGTTLLGRYRVIKTLGHGATATVYLAVDAEARPKALKVFPKGLEGRAEREWKVGQALRHPHINAVLDKLEVNHQAPFPNPALLLSFAPGQWLLDWCEHHPDKVWLVFGQLLEALAHMHRQGFVHRDIKPENCIVDGGHHLRLIDFDLSGPSGEKFSQRLRVGTTAYLSPEQIRGLSPTPAADVYSFGVCLYWGLAGELPYSGNPSEVMKAHLEQPVPTLLPRPETGLSQTPKLQSFLERLMAKDPSQRFMDGGEALEEFEAFRDQRSEGSDQ